MIEKKEFPICISSTPSCSLGAGRSRDAGIYFTIWSPTASPALGPQELHSLGEKDSSQNCLINIKKFKRVWENKSQWMYHHHVHHHHHHQAMASVKYQGSAETLGGNLCGHSILWLTWTIMARVNFPEHALLEKYRVDWRDLQFRNWNPFKAKQREGKKVHDCTDGLCLLLRNVFWGITSNVKM